MSYDCMVFDATDAPRDYDAFMAWHGEAMEALENQADDEDPSVASPALQAWYNAMTPLFPPLSTLNAAKADALDETEMARYTDYNFGPAFVYAMFSWSAANEARAACLRLAREHGVVFYAMSDEPFDVFFPDGTVLRDGGEKETWFRRTVRRWFGRGR